jgi:hypothetical protein
MLLIVMTMLVLTPQQMLDRVLAVIEGSPITLSDVNAAVRMGLVPAPASKTDPEREALDSVIDRRLQLIEVNRYLPPEPPAAAIDARLAETRQRFQTAEGFDAALKESGLTPADLRAAVRDSLRIASYLEQRFGAGYQPGEDEVLAYYRANEATFTRDGVRLPYNEARDDARRRLMASRTSTLVRDWITGLRRRVDVTIVAK